jgi:hypothetical protein
MLVYGTLGPSTVGIFTLISFVIPLLVAVWPDEVTSPQDGAGPLCYGE